MKKILVVDNDRIFLSLMKKLLEKEGHQVTTAEDGLHAFDMLRSYTPDVIFVDLVMPNIDGGMLCRIIRSIPKFEDVYLVIISAISAEEVIDIVQLRANACIAKGPFNETAQHVLAAVNQPDFVSSQCLSGKILGIESIYPRGITEELLSVKKHLEAILERMSEGVLEINSEGRIVYANPAALSLFDMSEKNLLGSNLAEVFPGDSRYRVSDLMKTKGDKSKTITEDSPLRLNEFQVVVNMLPLDEDESKFIIILHDVSERKRAEETLRKAHDELEHRVEERTVELVMANEQLKGEIDERKRAEEERENLIKELQKASGEINMLRGILPLCSFCKKIRDDKGYWEQVDVYIRKHSQASISHSICPDCAETHYPNLKIYDE